MSEIRARSRAGRGRSGRHYYYNEQTGGSTSGPRGAESPSSGVPPRPRAPQEAPTPAPPEPLRPPPSAPFLWERPGGAGVMGGLAA